MSKKLLFLGTGKMTGYSFKQTVLLLAIDNPNTCALNVSPFFM